MGETMSAERLAEIHKTARRGDQHLVVLGDCDTECAACAVDELLAEVERLHKHVADLDEANAYLREINEQMAQMAEERKMQAAAYRALAEEHQKRGDKLSARLAEHFSQWEVRRDYPNGNTIVLVGMDETQARVELAENGGVLFERCAAGEWRGVPDA